MTKKMKKDKDKQEKDHPLLNLNTVPCITEILKESYKEENSNGKNTQKTR